MEQGLPPVNLLNWMIAIIPVGFLLLSMLLLKWSGSKAGAASWFLAVILSIIFFGANFDVIMSGITKGLWTTIWVLYVIWPAMLLYNVVEKTGGFKRIGKGITALTNDKVMQLFLIGWIFPSFLQGVCGFGAPVAVAAPLLVGLGFPVVIAAAVPLIGHSWSVTFGSMGSSYFAASLMTGFDSVNMRGFAIWGALLLGIACVITGLCIAFIYNGWKSLRRYFFYAVVIGLVMGGVLNLMVRVEPAVGSFSAGIAGMIIGCLICKVSTRLHPEQKLKSEPGEMSLAMGFGPYLILIVLVLGILLPPPLRAWAKNTLVISFPFPEIKTNLGFITEMTKGHSPLKLLAHPGSYITVCAIIGSFIYKAKNFWPKRTWSIVLKSCVKQTVPGTLAISSMVIMSIVMLESGMTTLLAHGTANAAGAFYPIVASWVGVLGAFMTGSGTASNVLFSAFQRDVALLIGVSPWILLAAQTAGGSIGNMICPFNVVLGATTTGSIGREGEIMKRTLPSCIIIIIVMGVFSWFSCYIYQILPSKP